MEKIEGINLGTEAQEVLEARLDEERQAVRKQINGIHTNIIQWTRQMDLAEKDAQNLQVKIDQARIKLDKIASGDWTQLKTPDGDAGQREAKALKD